MSLILAAKGENKIGDLVASTPLVIINLVFHVNSAETVALV